MEVPRDPRTRNPLPAISRTDFLMAAAEMAGDPVLNPVGQTVPPTAPPKAAASDAK